MSDFIPNRKDSTSATPILLKAPEAARMLSVSERTLWNLVNSGTLPAVRIGRSVRYAVSDLQAFVAANRSKTVNDALSAGNNLQTSEQDRETVSIKE